jgi:plasmid stabilization system protein ParE
MKVVWTRNAIADLTGIYDHIARDSPRYATVVVDRITARSAQLETFPQSGQMVPEYQRDDIREVVVHSFRVIYLTTTESVSVLTVVHGARPLPDSQPPGADT